MDYLTQFYSCWLSHCVPAAFLGVVVTVLAATLLAAVNRRNANAPADTTERGRRFRSDKRDRR